MTPSKPQHSHAASGGLSRAARSASSQKTILALITLLSLAGCVPSSRDNFPPSPLEAGLVATSDAPAALDTPVVVTPDVATGSPAPPVQELISAGGGLLVAAPPSPVASAIPMAGGEVTLNFEGASVPEVAKVMLGDLLGLSYTLDPGVQGAVTLRTSRPLARDAVLPTLELALRMNGAALVVEGDIYRIVPQEQALRSGVLPQLGGDGAPFPAGYSVRVLPLRFVAATEMRAILEPMVQADNLVRVDALRNLLVLAGTSAELRRLEETVRVFDVDWLRGMSVAMYRPAYSEAKTLAGELRELLVAEGGEELRDLVRLVTIERLNALVAVSPHRRYLDRVGAWVDRLDQKVTGAGKRLFVYKVQNGNAVELAEVLGRVFEDDAQRLPEAEVAPGLTPVALRSTEKEPVPEAVESEEQPASRAVPLPVISRPAQEPAESTQGVTVRGGRDIRIIPDEINNSLLVLATLTQYREVEAALRQLDVVPLQVLIEATIAEVTLTDELSQGLEWFFKNSFGNYRGNATLDTGAGGLAALVPGLSYSITDPAGAVRAVLNLLATQSRANIVSSPSLMVLNNQEASIRVGDEVPITTQQQQSTDTSANVLNSVEYRDTGVLLTVTPRVNPGGLIVMEIEQEVSNVAPGTAGTLTPTIQQRNIRSTVAIESGQTVVLGGLIRDNRSRTEQGIPGLHNVPVLGFLFGSKNDELSRTELVVLITPRAVENAVQAERITSEFRAKMESLKPVPAAGATAVGSQP